MGRGAIIRVYTTCAYNVHSRHLWQFLQKFNIRAIPKYTAPLAHSTRVAGIAQFSSTASQPEEMLLSALGTLAASKINLQFFSDGTTLHKSDLAVTLLGYAYEKT